MTTNGAGLLKKPGVAANIEFLFYNGLNVLAIDEYEGVNIGKKIREVVTPKFCKQHDIKFYEYPEQKEGNPHTRRKPGERVISFVQDISVATKGTHNTLNNHAGYGAPLRAFEKPCGKPFREMSIDWNGKVPICCIAWGGEYIAGDVTKQKISEIWQGDRFNAMRQKLLRGQRDTMLCKGCDHPTHRIGLLPDKKGQKKDELPLPDEWTEEVIAEMDAEGYQEQPTEEFLERKKGWGS